MPPTITSPPASSLFQRPSRPAPRPAAFQPFRPQPSRFAPSRPAPRPAPVAAPVRAAAFSAPAASAPAQQASQGNSNVNYEGPSGKYHLSWRAGRSDLTWNSGVSYCQRLGMKMVSLTSQAKNSDLLARVTAEAPYFWAGGKVSGR